MALFLTVVAVVAVVAWLDGLGDRKAPPIRVPTDEEMDDLSGNEWIFDE